MKFIQQTLFLALLTIFVSCEDFLEENAPDFLDPSAAYQTEDDLFQALVGAYDRLGSGSADYYKRRFLYMINFASDEMDPIDLGADKPLDDFTFTSNDPNISSTYNNIYSAIAAANAVINNADNISG